MLQARPPGNLRTASMGRPCESGVLIMFFANDAGGVESVNGEASVSFRRAYKKSGKVVHFHVHLISPSKPKILSAGGK